MLPLTISSPNILFFNKATILIRPGHTDRITVYIAGTSPFPELESQKPGSHPPGLEIQTREGYALTWLKDNLTLDADDPRIEVIDTGKQFAHKFSEE